MLAVSLLTVLFSSSLFVFWKTIRLKNPLGLLFIYVKIHFQRRLNNITASIPESAMTLCRMYLTLSFSLVSCKTLSSSHLVFVWLVTGSSIHLSCFYCWASNASLFQCHRLANTANFVASSELNTAKFAQCKSVEIYYLLCGTDQKSGLK